MINPIGTKLVFENDKIKVWEFVLAPGEKTERHHHELNYMFYVFEGGVLQIYDKYDQPVDILEVSTAETLAYFPEGEHLRTPEGTISPIPAHHSAKNIGTNTYREIIIEMKS